MKRISLAISVLVASIVFLIPDLPVSPTNGIVNAPRMQVSASTSHNWSGYVAETNFNTPENYAVTDVRGHWIYRRLSRPLVKLIQLFGLAWTGMVLSHRLRWSKSVRSKIT